MEKIRTIYGQSGVRQVVVPDLKRYRPKGFTRQTVAIALVRDEKMEVEGWVKHGLAVTPVIDAYGVAVNRSRSKYRVTHVASGMFLPGLVYLSKKQAQYAIDRLTEGLDWTRPGEEITRRTRPASEPYANDYRERISRVCEELDL